MSDLTVRTGADRVGDLERWLTERVAYYLDVPGGRVDPDVPLVELGLDSVYAMTLSGDIEERFDLELEPTVAWDHSSIRKLAAFLHEELGDR